MITFHRNTEGTKPVNTSLFFLSTQRCQKLLYGDMPDDSIHPLLLLACFISWKTAVSVPLPYICFNKTSKSVLLQSFEIVFRACNNTLQTFLLQLCLIKHLLGFSWLLDGFTQLIQGNKRQMTNPNTNSNDSCHCTSPAKLWCHAKLHTFLQWAQDYYHFAKWK